jgi:hypothetical protein
MFSKPRAFLGALAILLSAIAAPVTLAIQAEGNVCAMACCVTDGYCCCKPHKPFVKGQARDHKPSFEKVELTQPCSQDCASPSSLAQRSLRIADQPSIHAFRLLTPVVTASQPPPTTHGDAILTSTAPRAPPLQPPSIS